MKIEAKFPGLKWKSQNITQQFLYMERQTTVSILISLDSEKVI